MPIWIIIRRYVCLLALRFTSWQLWLDNFDEIAMAFHHFVETKIEKPLTNRIKFLTDLRTNQMQIHHSSYYGSVLFINIVAWDFNVVQSSDYVFDVCVFVQLTIRCLAISSYDRYSRICSSMQSGKSVRFMVDMCFSPLSEIVVAVCNQPTKCFCFVLA